MGVNSKDLKDVLGHALSFVKVEKDDSVLPYVWLWPSQHGIEVMASNGHILYLGVVPWYSTGKTQDVALPETGVGLLPAQVKTLRATLPKKNEATPVVWEDPGVLAVGDWRCRDAIRQLSDAYQPYKTGRAMFDNLKEKFFYKKAEEIVQISGDLYKIPTSALIKCLKVFEGALSGSRISWVKLADGVYCWRISAENNLNTCWCMSMSQDKEENCDRD